jgi:DNA replication and repair protein RecF
LVINRIHIRGFRNLTNLLLELSSRKNLIYGLNGAGKTSVLEAIFMLGFGKSFLKVGKSDVMNRNMDSFSLLMNVNHNHSENELSAVYRANNFNLFLDEKKINLYKLNHYFYPVFFSSSDYNRAIESITVIRRMINRFIFGVYPLYIHYILSYNKALKQKNILLKTKQDLLELKGWNRAIAEMSEKIVHERIHFLEDLNLEIKKKFKIDLLLEYKPSFDISQGISREVFFKKLEDHKKMEIKSHSSLTGPHLDCFKLVLNGRNLKFYSSGEKKLHLLMVYISFIELFKAKNKKYPVFLVDDFDTAIDDNNIDFLMQNYPDLQVVATSVSKNKLFDKRFELKMGSLKEA